MTSTSRPDRSEELERLAAAIALAEATVARLAESVGPTMDLSAVAMIRADLANINDHIRWLRERPQPFTLKAL